MNLMNLALLYLGWQALSRARKPRPKVDPWQPIRAQDVGEKYLQPGFMNSLYNGEVMNPLKVDWNYGDRYKYMMLSRG